MAALRVPALIHFYVPLGLTSLIALSIQPLVTFFMGHARFPLESLAVLPVIHGLTFIFRAIGLSYLEVAIALLGTRCKHFPELRNFAYALALLSTAGLSTIAFTPLAHIWFQTISGLTPTLTSFALLPIQILAIFPMLSVALHLLRAVLVHEHCTRPITWATTAELVTVTGILIVTIHTYDLVGSVAAAAAILIGRIVGVIWLVPTTRHVLCGDNGKRY